MGSLCELFPMEHNVVAMVVVVHFLECASVIMCNILLDTGRMVECSLVNRTLSQNPCRGCTPGHLTGCSEYRPDCKT